MFCPFELFIGLRYSRSRRRNHFISFISLISMLGVALGVAALIVVLSVMNGFEQELRQRILGMTAHATVSNFDVRVEDWPRLAEQAANHPHVIGTAPYIEGEAIFRHGRILTGGMLYGVLPEREGQVSDVGRRMVAGRLEDLTDGGYGVVLGKALAEALGVGLGDAVDLMVPQANLTPAGLIPRLRRFRVVGVFEVGMYEYDRTQAFVHIRDAARLMDLGEAVSGVRLRLDDLYRAPQVSRDLVQILDPGYFATDWTRRHANFFRAIRTEKTVMFIILAMIVGVAAFNIVSTLVMVVTDKQGDIAILRTLGASPASIMGIFIVQGVLIGVVGTLAGVAIGTLVAVNVETLVPLIERAVGFQFLPADVYYISELPSRVEIADIVQIAVLAFALSLLSTLYPAWRAARTEPAEALRYE
ncbi:MAG TPA: lipoprotein-releasing ABC transporter permease subunit [Candidatus Acidoferrales bacterium]|nr:lipoprotein-releasing ABC transporter permease subunit [Candidatus Acidoferrales bacterium]